MEAIMHPIREFWEEYSEFILNNMIIPHMTNTLNYACLGIIEESLEFLETVRSKLFFEENILEGGDVLFYAMLLQYHRPHLDINWSSNGLSLENTNDFNLKLLDPKRITVTTYMATRVLMYMTKM
jgi:hypothetical protein